MAKFMDTLISSSKKNLDPQNNRFGSQETCTELCGRVEGCSTVSLQTFFLEL